MNNLIISQCLNFNSGIKKLITVFSMMAISFWGVGSQLAMAATCENPDALTFAMVPTEETVAELQLYKPVTDRMENLTGKKIQRLYQKFREVCLCIGIQQKGLHLLQP